MMYQPKNIIIVGGNAAGPAAAAKAKRINPEAKVILFEQGEFVSTGCCEIPYVFSGKINNVNDIIFYTPESFFNEKKVEVYIKHRVEQIDRRSKSVLVKELRTNKLSKFNYDSLILATGSLAKKINYLPSELENVFYLKSVKDLIRLQDFITKNKVKSAAIIGSGFLGLEMAEAFKLQNIETTIIEKESLPFPKSEIEVQFLIKELLIEKNIPFYSSYDFKYFTDKDKIKTINLDGRRLEVDIVLISAGIIPNNLLAIQCGLEIGKSGGIKVDRRLKTSDSYVYAAGDSIEMINFITGKPDYFPFATYAHNSGHIAGENAAGGNLLIDPVIKNTAVKIFDYSLATIGLSSAEAAAYGFKYESVSTVASDLIKIMPGSKNVFGKIIYEKNTYKIIGASFLGSNAVVGYSDLISSLILSKSTAKTLSKINYNYTPPLSPFVNLLSILGKKLK